MEDLIEKFIAGDEYAFETLVLSHRASAEQFARRYVNNFHIAEEIVQDAFVASYVNRKSYKASSSFKTYFYTIVRNKCIDHIRKENSRLLYEKNYKEENLSIEERLIREEDKASIKLAIDNLHKPYKEAIYLVDIEECTYKDAAIIMRKTLSSFKITLFRARGQLKKDLLKEGYNESRR